MEITKYIQQIVKELSTNESHLNQLDAAIGDGDHGSNVLRGFKAILEQSSNFTKNSLLEKDMMICAQQLMAKIGGSSGPLLGSAFMALAIAFKNKTTITNIDIANGLQMAFDRISQLGKSKVGEKTMLDALYPTIVIMKNNSIFADFSLAAQEAKKGAETTISMLALKGRASYLGERSIGHMDPGACSISLIFKALNNKESTINNVTLDTNKTNTNETINTSDDTSLQAIKKDTSILLVSHSEPLAKSVIQFVSEMKNGDFNLDYVAGIENGQHFGTDPQIIKNKIQMLTSNSELLIIYDLGSSKMNTEMAFSMLNPEIQKRVHIAQCAFVEGALTAIISNHTKSAEELKTIVESQTKIEK